jgi:probable F420-dependent oxidoreductase
MGISRLQGIDPGRFGVFAGPLNARPASQQRAFAVEMERLGYGTLWYGESLAQEAFARGAIYLAATERLVIASGIANIWARDAAAMANGGRTLAEAWPGRFILGIGVSHAPTVKLRGHEYDRPYSAMVEYLDAIPGAPWRGPAAEIPPIVLAALGPRMVGLAGERTAGAYPYFSTTAHVREVRGILGPEPFLASDLPVVLAPRSGRRTGHRRSPPAALSRIGQLPEQPVAPRLVGGRPGTARLRRVVRRDSCMGRPGRHCPAYR